VCKLSPFDDNSVGEPDLFLQIQNIGLRENLPSSYNYNTVMTVMGYSHWLINYIDTKAKCRHLKKLTCKGTLRQVFICLRSSGPYPPPLTQCIRVYSVSLYVFLQRKGGGCWTREKVKGATVYKAESKIPTWLTISPLLQSPFTDQFLLNDDNLLWCLYGLLVHGVWRS
jgi:hypothetical protein